MLEQVLGHLRNWFLVPGGVHSGTMTIEAGGISLPFLRSGQYFRIIGSLFNDGIYQYPAADLTNETFDGAVWALSIPKAVLGLTEEITEWQEKNGEGVHGPYQSESFAGYTYTKATDAATGGPMTWQGAFADRLARWRKL